MMTTEEEGQPKCPFWENPFPWVIAAVMAVVAIIGLVGHLRWYF
ncbi:MAG: hypothetical protein V1926_05225 [Candidatus Peregrinibacteria bacterium]